MLSQLLYPAMAGWQAVKFHEERGCWVGGGAAWTEWVPTVLCVHAVSAPPPHLAIGSGWKFCRGGGCWGSLGGRGYLISQVQFILNLTTMNFSLMHPALELLHVLNSAHRELCPTLKFFKSPNLSLFEQRTPYFSYCTSYPTYMQDVTYFPLLLPTRGWKWGAGLMGPSLSFPCVGT